ncbi:LysM peptidoglycan-binding domain-containing protein [Candidatus Woesearchaeota archaeon]|nr:LysM peptidoglycan-binding domain-containing protein [Candidatus Woesearchaeota archaeon]
MVRPIELMVSGVILAGGVWLAHRHYTETRATERIIYTQACDGVKYEIQPRDTLWRIMKQYGIPRKNIIALNPHIPDENRIKAGEYLCLPEKTPIPRDRLFDKRGHYNARFNGQDR